MPSAFNRLLPSAYRLLSFDDEARALRGAGLARAVDGGDLEDVAAGGEAREAEFGHVGEARVVCDSVGAQLDERGGEDRLVVAEDLHLERHVGLALRARRGVVDEGQEAHVRRAREAAGDAEEYGA